MKKVKDVMTKKPATIRQDKLAAEAFDLLKVKRIDELRSLISRVSWSVFWTFRIF